MTNILILEDNERRINQFLAYHTQAIVTRTAQEAISELESGGKWDLVLLDHDLGGEIMVDPSKENTGTTVAKWIVDNEPEIDNIIIHSWNPDAAQGMLRMLEKAEYNAAYIPFGIRGYMGK